MDFAEQLYGILGEDALNRAHDTLRQGIDAAISDLLELENSDITAQLNILSLARDNIIHLLSSYSDDIDQQGRNPKFEFFFVATGAGLTSDEVKDMFIHTFPEIVDKCEYTEDDTVNDECWQYNFNRHFDRFVSKMITDGTIRRA